MDLKICNAINLFTETEDSRKSEVRNRTTISVSKEAIYFGLPTSCFRLLSLFFNFIE